MCKALLIILFPGKIRSLSAANSVIGVLIAFALFDFMTGTGVKYMLK